jgi:flavin-dependent dehydrogenase
MSINRTPSCINSQITGHNWLTTGDAASAYDPISAQGIYKALAQGIQAAEAIHKQQQGAVTALKQYSQKIKQQYAQYLEQRQYLYQQETRWQRFPFWQKRQGIEKQKSA